MNADWQEKVVTYLADTLGLEAHLTSFPDGRGLPLYLTEAYEIARCELHGQTFLALKARSAEFAPQTLEKHAHWLGEKTGLRGLFVLDALGAYQRKQLIKSRIPFLCPGNQLYVPDLGLDLREHLKTARRRAATSSLSPVAQVVVLACLLRKIDPQAEFTGAGLVERFGYTKMSMSRALEELRQRQWLAVEGDRKFARHRFLVTGRALWEQARPALRTPVTRRIYLKDWVTGLKLSAGETALAKHTQLVEPARMIGALTSKEWRQISAEQPTQILPAYLPEQALVEIEIWRYAPGLLTDSTSVDPLSLALSLEHLTEERVQMAVEELLRNVSW